MNYRLQLPEGYRAGAILCDPPWPMDENGTHKRRRLKYDRMTIDEIKSVPIHLVAHPDAHLWMWTTSTHLPKALEVVHEWGFQYKTLLAWRKPRLGLGWWLRSRYEFVIMAARTNNLRANPGNVDTEILGSYVGHSKKPDLYDRIERLSPGPYLELWADPEKAPRRRWERLSSPGVPAEGFGSTFNQKRKGFVPDKADGRVRGVGGLEIEPGQQYILLSKVISQIPVTAVEQKARRVKVELPDGTKKSISIDSLRPLDGHEEG